MNKNVCIIHFNTPALTAHLVKSINKHTPGTNIYIFDNSDKRPFVNTFNNVTVFDNTKGQIINFNQWLKKYPDRMKSGGKANKWGSAKHAYSVEKCMELIKEPFVLLDSDVLIKKDFSPLFDDVVCYKGEVISQPGTNNRIKRVLPFICFINTPMCFERGIHYFDENYMHGLRVGAIGDRYDTGAAIYLLTEKNKAPHREIKVSDYVVHYGNGSWVDAAEKMKKPKHMPVLEWLNKYRVCWVDSNDNEKDSMFFNDIFDHIYCIHHLPDNGQLSKIRNELKRVGIDENADYFSWTYTYPSSLLDTIYLDKSLKVSASLKFSSRSHLKQEAMKHYEIIKEAYTLGYKRILILNDNIIFHKDKDFISQMLLNMPDGDVVMLDKMTRAVAGEEIKYKKYLKTLPEGSFYGSANDSGVFFIFYSCYALSREAMEKIISLQEKQLLPPDTPLNDNTLTRYFAVTNLAIQDRDFAAEHKEDESYAKIGLNLSVYGTSGEQQEKLPIAPKPLKKSVVKPHTLEEVRRIQQAKKTHSVLNQKKARHTRRIYGNSSGYNKLYDVG